MIRATHVCRVATDVRSSGDGRRRVDAYFVAFECPADDLNAVPHEWRCRFEVPRGSKFVMRDFASKAEAHAAKGWTL